MLQDEVHALFSSPFKTLTTGSLYGHSHTSKSKEITTLAKQVLESAESAVGVLNDLLNYDKIERGQLTLEASVVDFWSLVEKCVNEFSLPFEAKNIEFGLKFVVGDDRSDSESTDAHVTSAGELPQDFVDKRVIGDAIRITQILRNLVSNCADPLRFRIEHLGNSNPLSCHSGLQCNQVHP